MIHELKILPEFYEDIRKGNKSFEVRKNDRNYKVGDYLGLNEFVKKDISAEGECTGRWILARVVYILDAPEYCKDGYVILGLRDIRPIESDEEARYST